MKSYVVIEHAKKQDYLQDYVALPKNYGTPEYYAREDVKEIRRVVFAALDKINDRIDLEKTIAGRHVIVKPNLVAVIHNAGYINDDMPQSTDPRVFEAVIDYLSHYTKKITIAESTGGQMGTTGHFKTTGLTKVAERYGADIVAFENMPIDRYMLPKAEVMKEIAIPRILSEVVNGDAFYVSVPKMKTNSYTEATLSFKNAMGSIPAQLRYRNHSYQIDRKLVDMLYLFKPDLVVIDGIVGAEGLTPGPVDPVDTRMIIAGNQSVEADRITTAMMGIDITKNKLLIEADKSGFGDPDVEIIGEPEYFHFRPADNSFLSDRFRKNWPDVRILVGLTPNANITINSLSEVTPELVREMEKTCSGGCRPAITEAMEMYLYAKKKPEIKFTMLYGQPVVIDGKEYYFDADAKPWTKEDVKAIPEKVLAMGECTRSFKDAADTFSGGCCDIGSATLKLMSVTGAMVPMMSPANKGLMPMMGGALKTFAKRVAMINVGEYYDLPYVREDFDKVQPIPELSEEDMQKNYLPWPMPHMTAADKRKLYRQIKIM